MKQHNILGLKERFEKLCDERGIKPYTLVSKGIIKEGTVVSIKKGSMPAADALLEVARALHVTIEELLTGEGPKIEYGLSNIELEYIDKLRAIFKSGNDAIIAAVKATIDALFEQIVKKTKVQVA